MRSNWNACRIQTCLSFRSVCRLIFIDSEIQPFKSELPLMRSTDLKYCKVSKKLFCTVTGLMLLKLSSWKDLFHEFQLLLEYNIQLNNSSSHIVSLRISCRTRGLNGDFWGGAQFRVVAQQSVEKSHKVVEVVREIEDWRLCFYQCSKSVIQLVHFIQVIEQLDWWLINFQGLLGGELRSPQDVQTVHLLLSKGTPDLHEIASSSRSWGCYLVVQFRVGISNLPGCFSTLWVEFLQVRQQVAFDQELSSSKVVFADLLPLGFSVSSHQRSQNTQHSETDDVHLLRWSAFEMISSEVLKMMWSSSRIRV